MGLFFIIWFAVILIALVILRVAPSKNFDPIADGEIDQDSPLTVTLMTKIRDQLIHLEEWLGDSFVAAKDHNHDEINSAAVSLKGSVKYLATSVTKVNSTATVNVAFTTIDISADTSPDIAVEGIFQVSVLIDNPATAGAANRTIGIAALMRLFGSAQVSPKVPEIKCRHRAQFANNEIVGCSNAGLIRVPLDASQRCEYSIAITNIGFAPIAVYTVVIELIGYVK